MQLDNWWHVTYATVAYFHRFFIKNPIFVLTLREKGGLNQIILHFRCFLLVLSLVFVFGFKTKGLLNPHFFNVSKYNGAAFWKISLLDDRSESLLLDDLDNSLKFVFG